MTDLLKLALDPQAGPVGFNMVAYAVYVVLAVGGIVAAGEAIARRF